MKIRILSPARADLLKAARFYEKQEAGLGLKAYQALENAIDELVQTGGQHPIHGRHYRFVVRGAFKHFCIYYKLVNDQVSVHAVFDHRRDSARLERMLRSRS